jgi:YD repeat-containing protein
VAGSLETTGADHSPAPPAAICLPPLAVPGYEVLIELGRGGMGVVHQARHLASGRLVALKVLRDALLDSPQQRSRFRIEADALTRLRHPNVVGLIEAGEQDGRPYFVMELVTGGSLDRRLAGKPQPAREAAELVETLARAVGFAHQQGIVHRDLKPGNILLAEDGTPKLNDFGLARQLDADTRQTNTGAVLGTPRYMSPEQAEGRPERIGPATDVWALGVILYEMLTGRTPFAGALVEVLDQIRNAEPEPPSKVQPDTPRDLETICLKCLHTDPAKRYASAVELAEDLRRFREDRPIKARRVGLRERAVKWRRRNPVLATLAVTAVLLLLAGSALGVWFWDRYQRVKVEYFATYTSRYGVKEGVVPLSAKAARQRDISYKFYRRGGLVVRMEVVNSRDELTVAADRAAELGREHNENLGNAEEKECRFEYTRNQQGQLLEETAYDRTGLLLWALHYTSPTTAHYTTRRAAGAGFGVEGLPQARTRAGATYLQITWTKDGFEAEVRYLDSKSKPAPDEGHTYGNSQEHDERGLLVRHTWLDAAGQPVRHSRTKVATTTFQYDEMGNRIRETYLDPRGKPCVDRDHHHSLTTRFDDRGNRIEGANFGVDGRPCLHRRGFHRVTARYDEQGNLVEKAYFGVDQLPCLCRNGYHKATSRFDDRGNPVELAYFDVDGRPCLRNAGFHRGTIRCDERGNHVEEVCFDIQGRPCLHRNRFHRLVRRFDDRGNPTEETYFDTAGQPCLHVKGFHRITARYDERGNAVEEAYFGVDQRPCSNRQGYHRFAARHDEQGNCVEVAYFDTNGRPCVKVNGIHKITARYDERGNRIEEACFGVTGQPCLHPRAMHRITARYDERGNRIEEAYFDKNGRPCPNKDGFHRITTRFDARGNAIEIAHFAADGRPCLGGNRFHRATARYDQRGNRIEMTAYDVKERRLYRYFYDDRGRRQRTTGFLYQNQQTIDQLGKAVAWIARTVDDRGRVCEDAYHGSDGKPVRNKFGVARLTIAYDDNDAPVSRSYFDEAGKPLVTRVVVQQVAPNTQADRLKIQVGDILVSYDGRPVKQVMDVPSWPEGHARKDSRPRLLVILRKGETITLKVAAERLGVILADMVAGPSK